MAGGRGCGVDARGWGVHRRGVGKLAARGQGKTRLRSGVRVGWRQRFVVQKDTGT